MEREKKPSGQDLHPCQGTQKKRKMSEAQGSSLGSEGLSHSLGIPVLGSNTRKMSPFTGLKPSEAYWKSVRSEDSTPQECKGILVYSQSQHEGRRLKTSWDYGWLGRTCPEFTLAHTKLALYPLVPALFSTKTEAAIVNQSVHT